MNLVPSTDPILRQKCAPVESWEQIAQHVKEMRALMKSLNGLGLAAPQVGIPLAFFVSVIRGQSVVINPVITKLQGSRISVTEGCLTWPGKRTYVARYEQVVFTHVLYGVTICSTLRGLDARVIQHETDHLNGICIF